MTFFATFGHPPTESDLKALTDQYGLWESTGFIIPIGYATLRSQDHHFVDCRAWSLDQSSNATYISGGFDRVGAVPNFVSPMIPTALCPMIYWNTNPRKRIRGRTYCTGLTEQFTRFTGDTSVINDLYGDALVTQFEELAGFFSIGAGATQVIVETRDGGLPLPTLVGYPVESATVGDRLMGVQRRRTRHGR